MRLILQAALLLHLVLKLAARSQTSGSIQGSIASMYMIPSGIQGIGNTW